MTAGAADIRNRKQTQPCLSSNQTNNLGSGSNDSAGCCQCTSAHCISRSLVKLWWGVRGLVGGSWHLTPVRKPSLKELGSTAHFSWPLKSSWIRDQEEAGRKNRTTFASFAVPSYPTSDRVCYTRCFRALLSAANKRERGSQTIRVGVLLIRHYNPHLSGHIISQSSLHIGQSCRSVVQNMYSAGRDGCLEMASMRSGSCELLLYPSLKLHWKSTQIRLNKLQWRDRVVFLDSGVRPVIIKYDS